MDRNEIIELWLRQISESFAEVNQFQNSDNYELFANWEQSVWELLETHDELSVEMIEGKVAEVNSILTDARDEITWEGLIHSINTWIRWSILRLGNGGIVKGTIYRRIYSLHAKREISMVWTFLVLK